MFKTMEKIQYALIYMLYKAKYYKSGKGYIFRANQIIAFILAIGLSIPFLLVTKVELTSYTMLIFFSSVAATTFYFLEKNVTKSKLMSLRPIYRSRKKYLIPFYFSSFVLLILFVLVNYFCN